MSMVSMAELAASKAPAHTEITMSMDTVTGFETMQRAAKLFASSSIVPKQFQGNLPNCFIAVDMAMRMQANPLMVMQNLYIVHGSPAWSAQFLIATFNKSGRFSAIRYEFQGEEGNDDWGCRAVATERATSEKLVGPLITIGMAKGEGWYDKPGSKWQTMPEQMLRYRAASWFVRVYAPEIAMGLQTVEEVRDATITIDADVAAEAEARDQTMDELAAKTRRKKAEPEVIEAAPEPEPAPEPDGLLVPGPKSAPYPD